MPRSISALSAHKLFSEYRGPRILNEEGAPPPPATPPTPPKEGEGENPPATPPANPKPDETEGRISQLAKENKELKEWRKQKEKEEKDAEDNRLAEAGEHKTLAEKAAAERDSEKTAREAAETRAARFETQMKKQIEEQIKAISDAEKQKKITELLGGKPVEEQMEMLPNLLSLMGVAPQSFGNPTPTSSATPSATDVSVKKARHKELIDKTIAGTISGSERAEKNRLENELSEIFQKEQEAKKAK